MKTARVGPSGAAGFDRPAPNAERPPPTPAAPSATEPNAPEEAADRAGAESTSVDEAVSFVAASSKALGSPAAISSLA
jgi:hypothetical protein